MSDWKSQLQEEHREVCDRVLKLRVFIDDLDNADYMDAIDWNMLCVQRDIMASYLSLLETRMDKSGISTATI